MAHGKRAEHLGLKVISIPEHEEHGIDLEAFKDAIERYPIKVCLLMLNSHNPIGFTVSDDIKYQLAKLLHERDIYLLKMMFMRSFILTIKSRCR